MSLRDREDLRKDILSAKERDLNPLLAEGTETLELEPVQADRFEGFIEEAWFAGTRVGNDRMVDRVNQRYLDVGLDSISREDLEPEFRNLMHSAADCLNLSLLDTIALWEYLFQAWVAGVRTCEAEIYAIYMEGRVDVADEARKWLEADDGSA